MTETYGSGFGFGSYVDEEPPEKFLAQEMREEPAQDDVHELIEEVSAPEPEKPVTPAPKYEISQRPLRAKKHR